MTRTAEETTATLNTELDHAFETFNATKSSLSESAEQRAFEELVATQDRINADIKKLACPVCDGTGKQTIAVTGGEMKSFTMDCLHCNATGTMNEEQRARHERTKKIWCTCGSPSGTSYWKRCDTGAHGWDCNDCGKLVQIG